LVDSSWLLVGPAVLFLLLLFVYPFVYGFALSFQPEEGGWLANYQKFFTDSRAWRTIVTTFGLALPVTAINVGFALPIAFRLRRRTAWQRWVTTLLVVPITLGTVLIADGMLTYFGPRGWLAQTLQLFHLYDGPIRLTHNYWGVLISLVISGFPFAFLLLLSYVTGIDPVLARAAATLGANRWNQFRHIYLPLLAPGLAITFCLSFVQAFSVFPSAVLVGAPSGSTRVISIAAYEAAFENYDYAMASTIAMIMGFAQLIVVATVLGLRRAFYRGPVSGGKG
jgi:putative spermidine/putrescine transport system permease protein